MPLVARLTFRIVVEAGNSHYWRDDLGPKASRTQMFSLQDVSSVALQTRRPGSVASP